MLVDLTTAEKIESSRSDLFWDGWTLVHIKPRDGAWITKDGLYRNGRWYVSRRIEPSSDGKYNVPKGVGNGL